MLACVTSPDRKSREMTSLEDSNPSPSGVVPTPTGDETGMARRGIDIQQALSILSARSDPSENQPDDRGGGCGCCHGTEIPENAKNMGQTIDMLAGPDGGPIESPSVEKQAKERLEDERTKRLQKIQTELKSMSDKELLRAVLQVQEDRVATYREYERGFLIVLQTGNVTSYPETCSKVTASFSVLSETIKAIQEILRVDRARNDLVQLTTQLQGYEKEKLQLTAAHHLERLREKNLQSHSQKDSRIEKLLGSGVQSLNRQIGTIVDQINEIIDEIRIALVEGE